MHYPETLCTWPQSANTFTDGFLPMLLRHEGAFLDLDGHQLVSIDPNGSLGPPSGLYQFMSHTLLNAQHCYLSLNSYFTQLRLPTHPWPLSSSPSHLLTPKDSFCDITRTEKSNLNNHQHSSSF